VLGENVTLKFDVLKDDSIPAILNVSEQSRRMEEMMRLYGMGDASSFPTESTLILNTASPLLQKLESIAVAEPQKAKEMASYIYKISLLSQKKFSADEMQSFMKDSYELLMKL
jgi:molecular chaperone HtpG